jgi:F-type H+-transporting ATPase subunit b
MLAIYLLNASQSTASVSPNFFQYLIHSNVFNVLIAVVFLAWLLKKFNIASAVSNQRDKLTQEILSLQAQREESQRQLDDIKSKTANLSTEVEAILENARRSAQSMSEEILKTAQRESDRLVEMSKQRIQMEQKLAAKELQDQLLLESIEETKKKLQSQLTASDHANAIEKFIRQLSETVPELPTASSSLSQ